MDPAEQIGLLTQNWDMLQRSLSSLQVSVAKCKEIGEKEDYTFEEEESFDSMTARFSRTTDIYTQKVLRSVWTVMREPYVPFIDFMNKAEKDNIIDSADSILSLRELRNTIDHEYLPEALTELVFEVIAYYPELIKNIKATESFISTRNWLRKGEWQ